MTEHLYIFTVLIGAVTIVLVVGALAVARMQMAQTRVEREDEVRDLAAKATAAQADTAARLAGLQAELSAMATRLVAIETVLRSVE